MVNTEMQAWPEVRALAANPGGTLKRLSIGGPGLFGGGARQVPEASSDFLANTVDRGTFTNWVDQHARALDGMSLIVGRGREGWGAADRLYAYLTARTPDI
jgi:hypothetical protein